MNRRVVSPLEKPQLVSFDLWHTLITHNPDFRPARDKVLRQAISPNTSDEDFSAVLQTTNDTADRLATKAGIDIGFNERIAMTARALGRSSLDSRALKRLSNIQADLFVQHLPVLIDEKTDATLHALAENADLAIVSNTGLIPGWQMRQALEGLGVSALFEHVLFSNETGIPKPHSPIFEKLVELSGQKPSDIVHIGDDQENDVAGAQAAGMSAIYKPKHAKVTEVLEEEGLLV